MHYMFHHHHDKDFASYWWSERYNKDCAELNVVQGVHSLLLLAKLKLGENLASREVCDRLYDDTSVAYDFFSWLVALPAGSS